MPIKLEVISRKGTIFSEDVDFVVVPGVEGELGILPLHTPLLSGLKKGELRYKKGNKESSMYIEEGFLEVTSDRILVLAEEAEKAEDINIDEAIKAKKEAEEIIAASIDSKEVMRARIALMRELQRIKIAQKIK